MLTGRFYPRVVRRTLRAAGLGRSRGAARPLPQPLRDRLLAIPATTPHPRAAIAPRLDASDLSPMAGWLLTSPLASLAASFVLAIGVTLALGNPYQAGAATLDEMKSGMKPAATRVRAEVSRLASIASDAGEAAIDILPRAGMSASRAITRTVQGRGAGDGALRTETDVR